MFHAKPQRFRTQALRAAVLEALERRQLLSATAAVARDLDTTGLGADPFSPTEVNGGFVFAADDGAHGDEMWFSDGTHASLIMDIRPGAADGIVKTSPFVALGGYAYFFASDGVTGQELWRTDGTAAGTSRLTDIQTVAINESPGFLTVAGNKIYFVARQDTFDQQLYTLEASAPGGALKLTNFAQTQAAERLCAVGDTVFFTGGSSETGRELWASNGTVQTTRMVEELTAGTASTPFSNFGSAGGRLYFAANVASTGVGNELWTSDGTADGTSLVKNIRSGTSNSDPNLFTSFGGAVYFSANAGSGVRLWRTDGTDAGTVPVADATPGTVHSSPASFTVHNGALYFAATTTVASVNRGVELWKLTPAGTAQLVLEVTPGVGNGVQVGTLSSAGGLLYFSSGTEFYKSNGTAAGTQRLLDANFVSGIGTLISASRDIGGVAYVIISSRLFGKQVFKTDGTTAGTITTGTVDPRTGGSAPGFYGKLGDTVFYTARDTGGQQGLWADDGDSAVPARFLGSFSFLDKFTEAGGLTYFTANDASGGAELWRTDGTAAGTFRLLDNTGGLASPQDLVAYNGMLLFSMQNGSSARELWRSNGTVASTLMVKGATGGADTLDQPSYMTVFNGYCYFSGINANGAELWRTDGTTAGTAQFVDLAPGSGSSSPLSLVATGTRLFFTASPILTQGQVLYATDGTPAGTGLVKNGIYPPSYMTALGNVLLFTTLTVNDHDYGEELWRSDGTTAGTVMVKDVNPGPNSSDINALGRDSFATVGGVAYFSAAVGPPAATTTAVWRSDGTAAGTFQVSAPGANAPYSYATAGGGKFYFVNGAQRWWESDGVTAVPISDVPPLPGFGSTAIATSTGIYYGADGPGGQGMEPWKLSWSPFATLGAGALHVTGTGGHDQFALSSGNGGSDIVVTRNGQSLSFPAASVTSIQFFGGTGKDMLDFNDVPAAIAVYFETSAGNSTINVNAGTLIFRQDASTRNPNITVNVAAGANAQFNATQHLAELNINGGHATLMPGGGKTIVTRWISVSGDEGRLDLNDNALALIEGDPSRIGRWSGTGYGGVTGLLASAYHFGDWNGSGIGSTMAAQSAGLTTLAPATAGEALALSPGETATWRGQTLSAATVLIRYTYAGDANLDGVIDGGDYGVIDNFAQVPGASAYFNGDFNFDGVIDGGDYGIIDNNIQAQGQPL